MSVSGSNREGVIEEHEPTDADHEDATSGGDHSHDAGAGELTDHPEHEAYRPPRPLARPRVAAAVRDLLNSGHNETDQARRALERLARAAAELAELDEVASRARRALLGDGEAPFLADALPATDHPTHAPSERHEHHEPLPIEFLRGESLVHPSALLDVFLGIALATPPDQRLGLIESAQGRALDAIRVLAVTMEVLSGLPPDVRGRDRFDQFLDRLGDFQRFELVPLDLVSCIDELIEAIRRPGGSISRASEVSTLEIDDNTGRIDTVAPVPGCTDGRLTLTARQGDPFVERPGVTVAFNPCGLRGTDITWGQQTVSVTVPRGAKTGLVYFVKQDEAAELELVEFAAVELAAVFGNCPFLGRGASTSLMGDALRNPVAANRCFITTTGVSVTIVEAPAITLFRAVDQNGAPFGPQSLPLPSDLIRLEWEISGDASTNPAVQLLADGIQIAQNLPLRGTLNLPPPQVPRTYTLEVTSGCGVVRSSLRITVVLVLSFDPADVSIAPGQTATLTLKIDRPASTATLILLTSTPSHPTAPGWVTIPAGQTQVSITYPGLQTGQPFRPALEVLAYAPGCTNAVGRVWVAAPLGTHRIVAGDVGLPAIDVVGVHAALLPNGSVLLFAYHESPVFYFNINIGKSAIWDPAANTIHSIPMNRNLFCSGHAFLGDGRLLVAGGQSSAIDPRFPGFGTSKGADHDLHVFGSGAWTRIMPPNDMPGARWYPTCATLPDGRVLILSGYAAHALFTINGDYEIFDGSSTTVTQRASFKTLIPYNLEFDVYPFVQVLPGKNLFVHNHDTTWLLPLDPSNAPFIGSLGFTPFYSTQSSNTRTYNGQGACVMLPLDPDQPTKAKLLVIGGGGAQHGNISPATPASNTAEIFDFDSSAALDAQPGWRFTRDNNGNQTFLTNQRLMADAVLLPDGTVAIIGGTGGGAADDAGPPIMWIESLDPITEVFSARTGISVPRLYHSTALLLPDGSVLIAGSTGGRWHYTIGGGSANEFRLEIYYPPYLFRGPRPLLRLPTTSLNYGQQLSIEIPTGAAAIQKVALIRHGSTTHTNNMGQRYVGLKITSRTATHVNATLPSDSAIAPPGPYMLFVIAADANGDPVPSLGTLTMLGP